MNTRNLSAEHRPRAALWRFGKLRRLAAGCATLALSGAAMSGQYPLRETEPVTGSNIRREIGATSIPLNRGYAELTADEVADLRSRFASLAPADEPPFPLNGLRPMIPTVSRLQHMLAVAGELNLVIHVDAAGVAESVSMLHCPNEDLQAPIVQVLMETRYKPGKCAGQPCAMDLPFVLYLKR